MQAHTLQRNTSRMRSRVVGRGGKRGKTSGRGTKGQNARAGHKKRPEVRDYIKTLPKLRGRGKNSFKSFAIKPFPINLSRIESLFSLGEQVTPATLLQKGAIRVRSGITPRVKILGDGNLTKSLLIEGCFVSASARGKIEKAGGNVK